MKVLTTDQIRKADAYTMVHEPVSSIDLMERAARGLFDELKTRFPPSRIIRIFAGFGNNGGDGIALARMMVEAGYSVNLHIVKPERDFSPDASANIARLPDSGNLSLSNILAGEPFPVPGTREVVIDALFGSGLTREPEGLTADLIDHINRTSNQIISIDIPSGLFGEDNRRNSRQHVIRATLTLTFQIPKLAFFFRENSPFIGDWRVVPIGLHPGFIEEAETPFNYLTTTDAASWLKKRDKFDHKGTLGHSLLICGSKGKMGAAVLAARACIHSGCGLTTVHLPAGGNLILQAAVPEAMTDPDNHPDWWTEVPDISAFQSVGAGPGLGMNEETWQALSGLLNRSSLPLILDADALNLIARNPGSLLQIPKKSILTPHPGEYQRLFGEDPDDFSRLTRLRELAQTYCLIIMLKGAHTAVAGPDGSIWFNTTGNPGMATGGSGDVLTGLITSLLAQGYEPFTAARLGVFLHGMAGDLAAANKGVEALSAGDIIRYIGQAFINIKRYQTCDS